MLQRRTDLQNAAALDARVGGIMSSNSNDSCSQVELQEKMPQVHVVMRQLEVRPGIPYLVKTTRWNGDDLPRVLLDDVVRDTQLH